MYDGGMTTTPKTIVALLANLESVGGTAERDRNVWTVSIPRKLVNGSTEMVVIGNVGFYVGSDGKNHVSSSIHMINRRIEMVK